MQAAPGDDEDASSKLWLYRSVLTQQTDANSGLVGPIIVSRQGMAESDGSPSDVDVEFVTLYQVSNVGKGLVHGFRDAGHMRSQSESPVAAYLHTP